LENRGKRGGPSQNSKRRIRLGKRKRDDYDSHRQIHAKKKIIQKKRGERMTVYTWVLKPGSKKKKKKYSAGLAEPCAHRWEEKKTWVWEGKGAKQKALVHARAQVERKKKGIAASLPRKNPTRRKSSDFSNGQLRKKGKKKGRPISPLRTRRRKGGKKEETREGWWAGTTSAFEKKRGKKKRKKGERGASYCSGHARIAEDRSASGEGGQKGMN